MRSSLVRLAPDPELTTFTLASILTDLAVPTKFSVEYVSCALPAAGVTAATMAVLPGPASAGCRIRVSLLSR